MEVGKWILEIVETDDKYILAGMGHQWILAEDGICRGPVQEQQRGFQMGGSLREGWSRVGDGDEKTA